MRGGLWGAARESTREKRILGSVANGLHVIVFANEKGGTGKSTTAVHVAIALAAKGARVAAFDLDHRQRTLGRYLDNRAATIQRTGRELPMPRHATHDGESEDFFAETIARLSQGADFLVIDTPGRDDKFARIAAQSADTLVTPMNDSFVDFDMLGSVDPVTLELLKPSTYSESVWEARKHRAIKEGRHAAIDWVVVTNRLAVAEARNRRRLEERMLKLAKRVGFRVGPGLRDRVIYRELFPFGLTVADLSNEVRPVAVSLAHVAARQEMRNLMQALGLEDVSLPALDAAA
jgi:chromosome partitioning protein